MRSSARPSGRARANWLPFAPRAITLLDVIEHFPGDLATRLRPWVDSLPARVERIAIKVPVRDGLLFSMARSILVCPEELGYA